MGQICKTSRYGYQLHYDGGRLVRISNDTILVKRDRLDPDAQEYDTWHIFKVTGAESIGRLDFYRHRYQDKLDEPYWYITARIEYNGIVYETNYHCVSKECATNSPIPAEEYVVAAIDHLLSRHDKIIVYKKQTPPEATKMDETDQTVQDATGNCDIGITITIDDIVLLPNGDCRIKIGVKPAETVFGPKPTNPFIKHMILTESDSSHMNYQFTVKQINQFKRLDNLGIPTTYRVHQEPSLTCALNCVVTTVSQLLQKKYSDIFELLGY